MTKIENHGNKGGSTFSAPKSTDAAHQDQQGQGFIPGRTDVLDNVHPRPLEHHVPTAQDIAQDPNRNQSPTPLPPAHAGNNPGNVQGAGSQNRAVFSYVDPNGTGASFSIEREADGQLIVRAQGGVNQGGGPSRRIATR